MSSVTLRTGEPKFAQDVHQHRRQRHGALAGFRLGPSDGVEGIGALTHVQLTDFQVDVFPAQAAQL